jgi:hypothetical protein
MLIDINIIATNQIDLSNLLIEDDMIESYLFEEESGHTSIEALTLDSLDNFNLALKFVFNGYQSPSFLAKSDKTFVIDLSNYTKNVLTIDDIDGFYQDWLTKSNRDNNMDEYGMFIGIIGYIRRHQDKKHLIAVIYPRQKHNA